MLKEISNDRKRDCTGIPVTNTTRSTANPMLAPSYQPSFIPYNQGKVEVGVTES